MPCSAWPWVLLRWGLSPLHKMAAALKEIEITARGFDLEADLFAKACKKGLKLGLVPISYSKRVGQSKLAFTDAARIIWHLAKERA